jgi:enoyl-CoA hydratase/carnithine racemase
MSRSAPTQDAPADHAGRVGVHMAQPGDMNQVLVSDDDGIRTVTINRPDVKHALTFAMRTELCQLLADADRDPSVRAIIVIGTDPGFTAGVDFNERDRSFDPRQRPLTVSAALALEMVQISRSEWGAEGVAAAGSATAAQQREMRRSDGHRVEGLQR